MGYKSIYRAKMWLKRIRCLVDLTKSSVCSTAQRRQTCDKHCSVVMSNSSPSARCTRKLEIRANIKYFFPLAVSYSIIADGRRSSWFSSPHTLFYAALPGAELCVALVSGCYVHSIKAVVGR